MQMSIKLALVSLKENIVAEGSFNRQKLDLVDENIYDISNFSYPANLLQYRFEGTDISDDINKITILVNKEIKNYVIAIDNKIDFTITLARGENVVELYADSLCLSRISINCWNYNTFLWVYALEFGKGINEIELYRTNTYIDSMDNNSLQKVGKFFNIERPNLVVFNKDKYRTLLKNCFTGYSINRMVKAIKLILDGYELIYDINRKKSKLFFGSFLMHISNINNTQSRLDLHIGEGWIYIEDKISCPINSLVGTINELSGSVNNLNSNLNYSRYGWRYLPDLTKTIAIEQNKDYYIYIDEIKKEPVLVNWNVSDTYIIDKQYIAIIRIGDTINSANINIIGNVIGCINTFIDNKSRDFFYGLNTELENNFRYEGFLDIEEEKKNSFLTVINNTKLEQVAVNFLTTNDDKLLLVE